MSESSAPTAPTASKIQPTVCSSRPLTVALTAQIRMAPAAMSKRLTPIPMRCLLSVRQAEGNFACLQGKRSGHRIGYGQIEGFGGPEGLEEAAVVRDEQDGAVEGAERPLELLDRGH